MKKLFTILAFSLFTATMPVLAQSSGGYQIKSEGGANFRKEPSKSASVQASIPQGAKVRVVEKRSDGWYKVEYNGNTGYVAADLVEPEKESSSANSSKPANQNQSESKSNANHQANNGSSSRDDKNKASQNKKQSANKGKSNSTSSSNDRSWGIGLRLGEPTGITVKRYFTTGKALEINLGRSSRWGYNYDADDFYRNDKYDDKDYYRYSGYRGGFTTALQVHYLWQKPIASANGLDWYLGVGGQVRFTPITYHYYYNDGSFGDKDWEKWRYVQERRTDVDLGIDGTIGLEYTFREVPISLFVDANLFIEVIDSPFLFYGQGGFGARYNF